MISEDTTQTEAACPFCESNRNELIECDFENVLRCKDCNFVFADPRINWETSYEEDFADAALHPTFVRKEGKYVIRNRHKLTRLLNRMEPYRQTGRIVDVGCSAAFFLKLAEEHGWDPYGVEISSFGAEFSRKELDIDVFQGTLQEAALPSEHFDIVFSSHVLEHIDQPLDLLREMYRILRPGGAVVTVIPTQFSSPSYRFFNLLHGDPPPRHVSFYDKRTFEAFLKKAGFSVSFSQYNLELNRLKQLSQRNRKPATVSEKDTTEAPRTPHTGSEGGYGMPIRIAKSILNPITTLVGLGDELLAIGTKPAH